MASDVDAALHTLVAAHGNMSAADAKAYVKRMTDEQRYQRDVYWPDSGRRAWPTTVACALSLLLSFKA